jgi:hypothetical protein
MSNVYGAGAPGNVDQNLFQRIFGYINPIGSANAAEVDPDAAARAKALADAQAQLAAGNTRSSNAPSTLGPVAPIQSAATIPPIFPPTAAPPAAAPFQQPAHPSTMRFPMWPTPPAPIAASPTPPARPVTPTPATAYPAPTPPARPVTPTPATAYPAGTSFGGIDRQNLSATGYNPGTRMGTALDLSGLFGMPSDVNPPATAQPVRGGVLSKAGTKGLLKSAPLPPVMPADIRRKRALEASQGNTATGYGNSTLWG